MISRVTSFEKSGKAILEHSSCVLREKFVSKLPQGPSPGGTDTTCRYSNEARYLGVGTLIIVEKKAHQHTASGWQLGDESV